MIKEIISISIFMSCAAAIAFLIMTEASTLWAIPFVLVGYRAITYFNNIIGDGEE